MVKENDIKQLHKNKVAFLVAFAETGNVTRAAEVAKQDRTNHYRWMKDDPDYVEAFKSADLSAGDRLEQEARRRAVEGVTEPVYHKGGVVGEVQKYSDTLLIFLLKGAKPDKYADRQQIQSNTEVVNRHEYHITQTIQEDPESAEALRTLYKRQIASTLNPPMGDPSKT